MVVEEFGNKRIKEIVQEAPALSGVLNKYGFDFCCGGNQILKVACEESGISLKEVLGDMKSLLDSKNGKKDPQGLEISDLISHIMETHHVYLKSALPEVEFFSNKVAMRHGDRHPELIEINKLYQTMKDELDEHLLKEENILFPLIEEMNLKLKNNEKLGDIHCGSVNNPIHVMNSEHDSAKEILSSIRKLSNDFSAPEDACNSYRLLFDKLKEMDLDLNEHMKIETEVLFPRAVELENKLT